MLSLNKVRLREISAFIKLHQNPDGEGVFGMKENIFHNISMSGWSNYFGEHFIKESTSRTGKVVVM